MFPDLLIEGPLPNASLSVLTPEDFLILNVLSIMQPFVLIVLGLHGLNLLLTTRTSRKASYLNQFELPRAHLILLNIVVHSIIAFLNLFPHLRAEYVRYPQ